MQKIRVMGSRDHLEAVIGSLQDIGVVHLCRPEFVAPMSAFLPEARHVRHVRQVEAALDDVEEAMARLGCAVSPAARQAETREESLAREVRLARRARRAAERLTGEARALDEQRESLTRLISGLEAFAGMHLAGSRDAMRIYYLILSRDRPQGVEELRRALSESVGSTFSLHEQPLESGELALALVVMASQADRIDTLLPEAGVRVIALPEGAEGTDPAAALHETRRRLATVEVAQAELEARRQHLCEWLLSGLLRARTRLNDWLIVSAGLTNAGTTEFLFVLEGWLPAAERDRLVRELAARHGAAVAVEDVASEQWTARDVPVAISNPPLFRPFEVITGRLPSPRYGTIDPTPFVAVFFPAFFGLILGDVGYGTMLAALATFGWWRSRAGTTLRSVSQIAATCALFSILFGLLFGELFGDLGHRVFDMHALTFSREEAVVPFLILALAVGFVHMLLGLVLGALSSLRSDPRESLGRGLTAVMLLLTVAILLAAVNALPQAFFVPSVVVLLLMFPVLILVEGVVAPIEFLSRISNVLSYARIMALGTASVMLALVANQMVGIFGGAVVGVLFATLFHLVNFALGVFSPTIHALRLHFVEFYGTFYSPGGLVYRPFRHWKPMDSSLSGVT